jgi:hypothetical protein
VTDEDQIAALREEIRRAGRAIDRVRTVVVWCVAAAIFAILALPGLVSVLSHPHDRTEASEIAPFATALAAIVGVAIGSLVGALAGAVRSMELRQQLGAHLRTLEYAQQLHVLRPLKRTADGNVRKLVAALERSITAGPAATIHSELAPATAPDARGDEASPAERGR